MSSNTGIVPNFNKPDLESLYHPVRFVNTIREPGERMQFFGFILGALLLLGFVLPLPVDGEWRGFWDAFGMDFGAVVYAFFPLLAGVLLIILAAKLDYPRRNYAFIAIGGLPLILTLLSKNHFFLWGYTSIFMHGEEFLKVFVFVLMIYAAAGSYAFARLRHWYLDNGLFRLLLFVVPAAGVALLFVPVTHAGQTDIGIRHLFSDQPDFRPLYKYATPFLLVIAFWVLSLFNSYSSRTRENITWLNVVSGRILWMALPFVWFVILLATGEDVIGSFVGVFKTFLLTYGFLLAFMFGLVDLLNTPAYGAFVKEQEELESQEDSASSEAEEDEEEEETDDSTDEDKDEKESAVEQDESGADSSADGEESEADPETTDEDKEAT